MDLKVRQELRDVIHRIKNLINYKFSLIADSAWFVFADGYQIGKLKVHEYNIDCICIGHYLRRLNVNLVECIGPGASNGSLGD